MSLRDLKIPNFKFPKLKMKDIENIEEVNVEIDPKKINEKNKKHEYYFYLFLEVHQFLLNLNHFHDYTI